MMKKLALAVGVAAALGGASVAHAGYYEYAKAFSADWQFSGFRNANGTMQNDGVVTLNFTNVSGILDLTVPPAGTWSAQRKGTFAWDYNGTSTPSPLGAPMVAACAGIGFGGWDACAKSTNFVAAGSGTIGYSGVTGTHFVYDWNSDVWTSNGGSYTAGNFTISGSGLMFMLGTALGPAGSTIAALIGSGNLQVDHSFTGNSWSLTLTDLGGVGLESALYGIDNGTTAVPPFPAGNKDGKIDGKVYADGVVHIPEPASLALVGLGLAGLAARRRKAKAA